MISYLLTCPGCDREIKINLSSLTATAIRCGYCDERIPVEDFQDLGYAIPVQGRL